MKLLSVLSLLVLMLDGCSADPRMNVTISNIGGKVRFQIHSKNIRGLLGMRVFQIEPRKLAWAVQLNYFSGNEILYGEIPQRFSTVAGVTEDAKQVFPPNDAPPPILSRNTRFLVEIDAQYDSRGSAATRTFSFSFSTDSSGNIASVQRL
jgi:hypothetical protein